MNFFKSLISASSDSSSKRFISLYSLFLFTIVIFCNLFGIQIMSEIIYALVSLILGTSVLTLVHNKNTGNGSGFNGSGGGYYQSNINNQPIVNNTPDDLKNENDIMSEKI